MKELVWAGNGIRLHGLVSEFRAFLDSTGLETVTTWTGADLLPTDHPQNIGIIGISGQRGANKAVYECENLYVLGSSMSLPQTSTIKPFAPHCRKTIIHGEKLAEFFATQQISKKEPWAFKYKPLNKPPMEGSYAFNDMMTRMLGTGAIMVVDGGGTALYTGFQSSYIKERQRLICSSSMSAMGSGLPEAIGACLANGKSLTTCLIGDGSFMFNIQELQTIKHHNLPIKIFILNNGGYLAIRHTQDGFLEGRHCGVGEPDLSFPDFGAVSRAFGIPFIKASDAEMVGKMLEMPGPAICEVMVPKDQKVLRQGYRKEEGRFVPMDLSEMVY